MRPYYDEDGITIYHGDCRELLSAFSPADVIISDPPYDMETHEGARTLDKETRQRASDGQRGIVAVARMDIDFAALPDVAWTSQLTQWARRWCVLFCSLEMLGEYRRHAAGCWVRGGFWRRPDAAPQISGDRPAQPGEGIAILHRPGQKHWNGGGHHAYFEHCVVKQHRIHPTQKPELLMIELVTLFSDAGETILDPFAGSGTTLVAAKRLGRKAIGIEIEERYCEMAVTRLAQRVLPL